VLPISLTDRARVFGAMSDPTRLRLVELLASEDELCGTELAVKAGISMALLSHHWKVLSDANLVTRSRRGQRQYCQLNRDVLEEAFCSVWPRRSVRSILPERPCSS
jgi:DNA-binding transcriptional ArsR family regulator